MVASSVIAIAPSPGTIASLVAGIDMASYAIHILGKESLRKLAAFHASHRRILLLMVRCFDPCWSRSGMCGRSFRRFRMSISTLVGLKYGGRAVRRVCVTISLGLGH